MAKIENICVNIENGKKEYRLSNLLLDSLLHNYADSLVDKYDTWSKQLTHCCIKFSNMENISSHSEINNGDFDICLTNTSFSTNGTTNKITNKYVCYTEDNYIYDYAKGTAINIKLSDYYGKKICYLGFSYTFHPTGQTLAVLNVTNYDMYIEKGEEIRVTRIDEISSDAIFTSLSDKIKAPIHLYPCGIEGLIQPQVFEGPNGETQTIYNNAYAKLTNFGLSNSSDNIEVEYDIKGKYEINNNVFAIKNIWSPKGLYPSEELYPSKELYPDMDSFKYLILKFKLYQKVAVGTYDNYEEVETYTGAEYLQAIPLEKRDFIELNIKYERG